MLVTQLVRLIESINRTTMHIFYYLFNTLLTMVPHEYSYALYLSLEHGLYPSHPWILNNQSAGKCGSSCVVRAYIFFHKYPTTYVIYDIWLFLYKTFLQMKKTKTHIENLSFFMNPFTRVDSEYLFSLSDKTG